MSKRRREPLSIKLAQEVPCIIIMMLNSKVTCYLLACMQDLVGHDHDSQDSIEAERAGLLKFTEDKHNEILSYNNELAHLQTKLEEAGGNVLRWSVTITCSSE